MYFKHITIIFLRETGKRKQKDNRTTIEKTQATKTKKSVFASGRIWITHRLGSNLLKGEDIDKIVSQTDFRLVLVNLQ